MSSRYSSVNFGGGSGGLSTVGFTLYNQDRTIKSSRSTSGVAEVGTSTGIYSAAISVPEDWDGFVLWDDGQATATYALDERFGFVSKIQETEKWIRMLVNTFTNQSGFDPYVREQFAALDEKISDLPKVLNGEGSKIEIIGKIDAVMAVASKPIQFPENVTNAHLQGTVSVTEKRLMDVIGSSVQSLTKTIQENSNSSELSDAVDETKRLREGYASLVGSIKAAFEASSANIISAVKETTSTYSDSIKKADETYKNFLTNIQFLNSTFKLSGLEKYAEALDKMSKTDMKEQINLLLNLNRDTAALIGGLAPIKQGLKDILSRNVEKTKDIQDMRQQFSSILNRLEMVSGAFSNRMSQEKKQALLPFFLMAGGR